MATDTQLLDQYAAGDEAALQSLLARHWASCYRVALSLVREAAGAEDATQEAFLALLEEVRQERRPEQVGAWLRGVALNKARMQARAGSRRTRREEAVGRQRGVSASGEVGDPLARLEELTGHLEHDLRLPLELHFGLGYSHREVADLVGCPVGTASSRIRRGLASVKERLEERGQSLAPAALAGLLLAAVEQASAATPPIPALDRLRRSRPPVLPPLSAARLLGLLALVLVGTGVTVLAIPALSPGAGGAALGGGGGAPGKPLSGGQALDARGRGLDAAGGATPVGRPRGTRPQPTLTPGVGSDPGLSPASGGARATAGPKLKTSPSSPLAPTRLPRGQFWVPNLAGLHVAPDGTTAVPLGTDFVVWDLVQRRELTRRSYRAILPFKDPSDPLNLARVHGFLDDRTLVVSWDQGLSLVSVPEGRLLRTLKPDPQLSRESWRIFDGSRLLDPLTGQLLDLATGALRLGPKLEVRRQPVGVTKGLVAQVLRDEGTWASLREVRLWRPGPKGWELQEFELPSVEGVGPAALTFGADGQSLLLSGWGHLTRVGLADGAVLQEVRAKAWQILESEGLLVTSGEGRVVQRDPVTLEVERVLGVAFADDPPPLQEEETEEDLVDSRDTHQLRLALLADGTIAAADPNGDTVRLLSATGESSAPDYARPTQALAFAEGRLIAAHRRGGLSVWDPRGGQLVAKNTRLATSPGAVSELPDNIGQPPEPRALALATRGELAYLVTRGSLATTEIHRLEVASGRLRDSRKLSDERVSVAALDRRATRVATVSSKDNRTRVLSVETLTPIGPALPFATSLAFSESGDAIALCEYLEERGSTLGVYSLPEGEPLLRTPTPKGQGLEVLRLDATRGCLYAAQDRRLICFDLESGQERWSRAGLSGPLCLVREGRFLLTAEHNDEGRGTRQGPYVEWGQIQVLDAQSGESVAWLRSEAEWADLYSLAVSPDETLLAAGSLHSDMFRRGSLLVYDLEAVLPPRAPR